MATTFGNECFANNDLLQSVSLPRGATFGIESFEGNSALTSIYMPMLTTMGDDAFWDIAYATTMELGATIPTGINNLTFSTYAPQTYGSVVRVPINQVSAYDDADGISGDGLWYGWTIEGVAPAPAANPQTGDSSVYPPYKLGAALVLVGIMANRKKKAMA